VNHDPLVSILINNYNYARFLRNAIDSAIEQTYPQTEVIVVDDGSADESKAIIESYQDRVISVLKQNGGQASAFNAGFAQAKGEIILFLDSDDMLKPDTVERVVSIFRSQPETVKVQYRLQVIDANGTKTGAVTPRQQQEMPCGSLIQYVIRFGDYVWPPTSGNAFRADVLKQILPMPEDTYRISADRYLNWLSVVFGPIVSLEQPGGYYRVHGSNNFHAKWGQFDFAKLKRNLLVADKVYEKQRELIDSLYGIKVSSPESRAISLITNRTIFLKLHPEDYPFQKNLFSLCFNGFRLQLIRPGYHWLRKLYLAFWFVAMYFAPKSIAEALAQQLCFPPERQPWIRRLSSLVQKFG
jgi:glycosyltransferase involved in cell wall biosynthesis